ncbi:hypothetical protein GTA08_BOTSDO01880 [Neofusicoccum parvum]|nr:hypothetical protein GTA08_BOTSDO01880 [Neofusicoccum parvum]
MSTTTTAPIHATVSALSGGHLTLPSHLFITPAPPTTRTTVPSLCFLIRHPTHAPLLFDLGLKRDLTAYAPAQQSHIASRHPIRTSPDCAASLRAGGLDPAAVATVLLSHVHWDHVGTPADYPAAVFVVGAGTRAVLREGCGPHYPAAIFNPDELPEDRTRELPSVPGGGVGGVVAEEEEGRWHGRAWERLGGLPAALDFWGDGSVWVVDAPGHLVGHVNLLVRVGERRWVYLGGDCCHDPRILRGEKGIALYDDGKGGLRSVHADTEKARGTLDQIREFLKAKRIGEGEGEGEVEVEVVVAHDKEWMEKNGDKFFPGTL